MYNNYSLYKLKMRITNVYFQSMKFRKKKSKTKDCNIITKKRESGNFSINCFMGLFGWWELAKGGGVIRMLELVRWYFLFLYKIFLSHLNHSIFYAQMYSYFVKPYNWYVSYSSGICFFFYYFI